MLVTLLKWKVELWKKRADGMAEEGIINILYEEKEEHQAHARRSFHCYRRKMR
jgi:hypothetical protein